MKKSRIIGTALCAFLAFSVSSCNDSDDDGTDVLVPTNIVTTAKATSSLTTLVNALSKADESPNNDLITALSDEAGSFTVLAPTNAAFTNLLAKLDGFNSLSDFNSTQLQDVLGTILKYHVVASATVTSDQLTAGQVLTTLQGETLTVNLTGGVSFIDADGASAAVTTADISATNGVVHLIDKVLLPQEAIDALEDVLLMSITDLANSTPSLGILADALVAAEGDLPLVLKSGSYTVFAPTDDAFETFLEENNFTTLEDVPTDVLTQILLNHVLTATQVSTDLETGYTTTLSTAGPDASALSMYIKVGAAVEINGISTVTSADNMAINGVVHIVDTVIALPTIVTFATANEDFSELVTALTDATPNTDFVGILSRTEASQADRFNPNFTVFAPTNAAFEALNESPSADALTTTLLHHVISDANIRSSSLNANGTTLATPLDGGGISIIRPGTGENIAAIKDGAGNTNIGIIKVDIQALNGVIHVVNKLLTPNTQG